MEKMVFKPIQYFHQHTDILKLLPILNAFLNGNLKDYLMKALNLLLLLDNILAPLISYYGYTIRPKFNGSILRKP